MDNEKTIKIQKEIAKDVLNKLEAIDPDCILAGGAPRDWFFNKPANDLDFYIYIADDASRSVMMRLMRLGFKGVKALGHDDPTYKSLKCLQQVLEFEYMGQRIQVMVMNRPTFGCVLDHFNLDTSKAWWKGHNVRTEYSFLLAHMFKVFLVDTKEACKGAYIGKMAERYPDYKWILDGDYQRFIDAYAEENSLSPAVATVVDHWLKVNGYEDNKNYCWM